MIDRLNKTSICCVIFLDIIGYSQIPVTEQITCKEHFNALINKAILSIAPNDRIILDTGDGAAIALMGAPEEALFVAMTIRDSIIDANQQATHPLQVRTGINLGPVRVVKDINDNLNIIGDGINTAQRVMSFAAPNTILVSRSYYEIVSRLSNEITRMFTYFGIKTDKHVREHEVYLISSSAADDLAILQPTNTTTASSVPAPANNHWKYGLAAAAAGILLIGSLAASQRSRPAPPAIATPTATTAVTEAPITAVTQKKKADAPRHHISAQAKASPAKTKTMEPNAVNHTVAKAPTADNVKSLASPANALCTDAQRMLHQCG